MNEEWNERHMNMKRRLSKTGLFMSNIWCIQAVKSEAGISRINFTPVTHPLPLPFALIRQVQSVQQETEQKQYKKNAF